MVIVPNHRVMVGNEHFLTTYNGAKTGAYRQLNLSHTATDYFGCFFITVGHHLDGFCCPTPQGMNIDYIATAHMGEEATDGRLLRGDGNVDGAIFDQVNISRIADEGHHRAHAKAFGQHRGHNIGLIIVS